MSKANDHPGTLRGHYRLSFVLFAAFLAASSFFIVFRSIYEDPIIIAVCFPLILWAMYTGMRVCSAYAFQKGLETTSKKDAWLLLLAGILYVSIGFFPDISASVDSKNLSYSFVTFIVIFFVAYVSVTTGRKLAWLAGDNIGGRSTFLRFYSSIFA